MNSIASNSYDFTPEALQLVGTARLAYLRRVYSYFGLGIFAAIGGALVGMSPGVVQTVAQMQIFILLAFLGLAFFAQRSATNPARAVPTLVAFTFVSGIMIAPLLYTIAHRYIPGSGPDTIYEALFLTSLVFASLTGYVFLSKKDFSFMGATLTIGLFVLIGASIIGLFVDSASMNLALAVITVIIFSGFILFDTSRILNYAPAIPPTSAALSLYLDFLNIFLAMLRILTGGNRR